MSLKRKDSVRLYLREPRAGRCTPSHPLRLSPRADTCAAKISGYMEPDGEVTVLKRKGRN